MKIQSTEELEKIRQEYSTRLYYPDTTKVLVGMASCGIAAGGKAAFEKAIQEFPDGNGVQIRQTGCIGFCEVEPLVEIAETDSLINRAITRATVSFSEEVPESNFVHLPDLVILRVNDHQKSYTFEIQGEVDHFIKTLAKFPVRDLAIHRPSLEEVFLKYYKGEKVEN